MPVLSCGGMRYQMQWHDAVPAKLDEENQRNLEACIHAALGHGIRHIETARGYGTSEYQLGLALKSIARERFILQTKVAPSENPADFVADFEKSLSLLQVEQLDLLGLHGINNTQALEWSLRSGGCLEKALEFKKQGRIKHLGFSTHGHCDIINAAIDTGAFDYVNLHWYYIFQRNSGCIDNAKKHDMGVFIISPNDKGGMLYKPSRMLKDLTQPLSPMVFNDLYCLSNPNVHTLSIGAARPGDFDEHVKAIEQSTEHADAAQRIRERLDARLARTEGRDLLWDGEYPLPEWDKVPGEVNLLIITWLWTLYRAFELKEYAQMRYNLLGNGGHWFPGRQLDPERLPEIRQALNQHPKADQVIEIIRQAHETFKGPEQKRLSKSD